MKKIRAKTTHTWAECQDYEMCDLEMVNGGWKEKILFFAMLT